MDRTVSFKLARLLCDTEGLNYIETLIAYAAAPTIKGVKPSALMRFTVTGRNTLHLWNTFGNYICAKYGLDSFVLKNGNTGILVLLYKRKLLMHYLNISRNQPLLEQIGYTTVSGLDDKLDFLKNRFEHLCPHEVGVFLGIPIEDVLGFIENKGKNCLMCRYWKVYGDKRRAQLLFAAYDKARAGMLELLCVQCGSTQKDELIA